MNRKIAVAWLLTAALGLGILVRADTSTNQVERTPPPKTEPTAPKTEPTPTKPKDKESEKPEPPRPAFKPKEQIPVDQGVDFPVDI